MKRKILLWIAKCILSVAVAAVILSFFAFFYYNPPTHVNSESKATGYVRKSNTYWARMVEGVSSGKTDENGYNNAYPSRDRDIDILMMGSSQTEGLYVDEDKCMTYLLNEYFDRDGSQRYVYNVAMSAHTLYDSVNNLEEALDQYKPGSVVCLETTFLACLVDMAEPAVNNTLEEPAINEAGGIAGLIQENPFIKLAYLQYSNAKADEVAEEEPDDEEVTDQDLMEFYGVDRIIDRMYSSEEEYASSIMVKKIYDVCQAKGITPVIYYIPTLYFDDDNKLCSERDDQTKEKFEGWCNELGIILVDPTDRMLQEYEENNVLVSGFNNTVINYGHLNERGHEIMAQEIYKALNEKVYK